MLGTLVFACPVTRLLNLQVIEKSDSSGVVDGLTRLSCEVGIPKILLMDQDTALIKVMSEVEVNFKNLELKLHEVLNSLLVLYLGTINTGRWRGE